MQQQQISLTDFVEFILRAGMPKLTKVRQLKYRGPYNTLADFYRPMREAIIRAHVAGLGKKNVTGCVDSAWDWQEERRGKQHFTELAHAYIGWWGRKNIQWFEPPHEILDLGEVHVSVNPELGLLINGKPHLIKLYFKQRPLPKRYAEVAAHLMYATMHEQCPEGTEMAILDVRRRNLNRLSDRPHLAALVSGEVAALTTMWSRV